MRKYLLSILFIVFTLSIQAKDIVWFDGTNPITYHVQNYAARVVDIALDMFSEDMLEVTETYAIPAPANKAKVLVYQYDLASDAEKKEIQKYGFNLAKLKTTNDAFAIKCYKNSIVILGANGRGTAYGVLELSRMAGVSPWIWWGDIKPKVQEKLVIDSRFSTYQSASVQYRGIFLNDEDWSTRKWSYTTHDPSSYGHISSKTYRRIFELLLRLRANAIWPAMHEDTSPFFCIPGIKALADSCAILIGTSHCEPLLRNNVNEWDQEKNGSYNYITNKEAVKNYWEERLKQAKSSKYNMFTIGMRGIHDSKMNGVKTLDEHLNCLQNVINDQQELIGKYFGDPSKQIQVFVPYKEVLDVYEKGLKVPDYATLMWCDDNYGYMTRLSNAEEQKRIGGGGVYYHLSYWGRPHDYLWLCTTQPGLIYNEMRQAYDHNMRKLWIVNIHDPKVAGYDLELFLDLAWNINCTSGETVDEHYKQWLINQFGEEAGTNLFPTMKEFYRLCGERKPEFMGWNQVELDKNVFDRGFSPVRNTEFTHEFGDELQRYLDAYEHIAHKVREIEDMVRPELNDAYFATILYPVSVAMAQATKILEAQKARQFADGRPRNREDNEQAIRLACAKAQKAYHDIVALTISYNISIAGGKWENIMDMHPRDLPVFSAPVTPFLLSDQNVYEELSNMPLESQGENIPISWITKKEGVIASNCSDYNSFTSEKGVQSKPKYISMLGHSMKAISLPKGSTISYSFTSEREGSALLRIALIPTHPTDNSDIRYAVSIDGGQESIISIKEPFRSEQWKKNVLRGQAVKNLDINLSKGEHTLTIRALDDHIVLDQWMIDFKKNRKHYLFPTE